ncbi:MAG: histidine phosphatase family protein [Alphaproteobacteria bacterium]
MTRLALIRHAATAWSETGRIQGRTDVPLSPAGRAAAARWRPPPEIAGARWVTSPLARARETAALMGVADCTIEPRLGEMSWGRWEGRRLAELRAELGREMAENEARGLDFRPDGGESPREVQARLAPWLAEVAARRDTVAGVTHKGVIRAVFARAAGWNMTGRPPVRLAWDRAHFFELAADGAPVVARLNLALAP